MKRFFQAFLFLVFFVPFATFGQYLMSDVEKGSSAALQMQNNAIQSQYIRQNAEAQMQSQRNTLDRQKLELEKLRQDSESNLQSQRNNIERQKLELEKLKLELELMTQARELAKLKAANGEK